jgi:two-component system NarL family sensor kinase
MNTWALVGNCLTPGCEYLLTGRIMANQPYNTQELQRRNRELTILNHIAEALNRSTDLGEILTNTLAQVTELFDLQTGWVWLLREDGGEIYLAAAQNLPSGLASHPDLMEGSCYCLDTYRAGDLNGAANVNVITCSRLQKLVEGTGGLRYHASIPLYAHGKRQGVFNVASAGWQQLSPEDLRILYTVGDLLSMAVERARLFSRSAEIGALEERNRLAREIHDTLAQGLAGITLQLETAEALLESGSRQEAIRESVEQALVSARQNLEEARRSVMDLRAAPLEGRSLPEALARLVSTFNQRPAPHIEYRQEGANQPLPARVEIGLYRVAQEALENIAQHSGARQAVLNLSVTPERIVLEIVDDGQGFEPGEIAPDRFGLTGINERVRLLGGTLQLKTSPGAGTVLRAVLPLA